MKNNASVVAIILLVFMYMLIRPFGLLFSVVPTPSIFESEHVIEGETYTSSWINLVQINNAVFFLVLLIAIILLFMAFKKWHAVKFFDVSIIKKLDVVAYLFIIEGIITSILYFVTIGKDFTKTVLFSKLQLDLQHGLFLTVIGLLFALITSILTNAKIIKDENDLTI
ncbi:MAG: hypothetical protein CMC13_11865 [Flavobacteriaceae bacterium]|nr:hypothetical protein [Flavobacteriaceae bacterium]|tara:strand:- start:447 stop:950 length:504 start_codon:yes stop_codon:yes gene_type:complete